MTARRTSAAPMLTVLGVVLLMLWTYVGAYYGLGKHRIAVRYPPSSTRAQDATKGTTRVYDQKWMTTFFRPAGNVESWLRRVEVNLICADEDIMRYFAPSRTRRLWSPIKDKRR